MAGTAEVPCRVRGVKAARSKVKRFLAALWSKERTKLFIIKHHLRCLMPMVLQPRGQGPHTSTEMMAEVHTMKVLPPALFGKGSVNTKFFRTISREVATRLVKHSPSPEIPLAGRQPLQLIVEFILLIIHLCIVVESQIVGDRNEHEQKHAD